MPRSNLPNGPALVQGEIQSDEEVSRQESLLGERRVARQLRQPGGHPDRQRPGVGAAVLRDVDADRAARASAFVIVNFEGTVSIQPTLLEALADVFDEDLPDGEEPPPDPGEEPEPEPEGTVDEQVAALLAEASDLFDEADAGPARRRPGRLRGAQRRGPGPRRPGRGS